METVKKSTKIVIGDVELWTAPFGDKAEVTATEEGTKLYLLSMHRKYPELFEILVEDEDLCKEDLDGAFTVIVNPELVNLVVIPGEGRIGFRCCIPDKEPDYEVIDHDDGEVI